eukprot:2516377-Prymnesium_polylepis.2
MASATIDPPGGSRCGVFVCSSLISAHTLRAPTAYGALPYEGGPVGPGPERGRDGCGRVQGGALSGLLSRQSVATDF